MGKKKRKVPWAGAPSSSHAAAQVAHGANRDGTRMGGCGSWPPARLVPKAQGVVSPSCIAFPSSDRSRSPWEGWRPGVSLIHHSTLLPAQVHESSHPSRLCAPEDPKTRLGFPSDFVGLHSFPHCAAFLSRLWSLPVSYRSGFHGGWRVTSLRPPVVEEEWSQLGLGGFWGSPSTGVMDPKNKTPQNP